MRFARGPSARKPGFWDIESDGRTLDELLGQRRLVDCGDVDILPTLPEETWENVTDAVQTILGRGALPVVLGGDHAITFPVIRAFDEPVALIQFDAHMDYQRFTSGVRLGHANPMRAIDELPSVTQIVHAGIRAFRTDEDEVSESRANGNVVLSVEDLRRHGEDWLESLAPRTKVYVTLDMDVLDPPLVPAVNAPEPDGLQFGELCGLIRQVADRHEIVGIDVVEVNPMLDLPNQLTSFLAVQLVVFTIGQALRSQQRTERNEP